MIMMMIHRSSFTIHHASCDKEEGRSMSKTKQSTRQGKGGGKGKERAHGHGRARQGKAGQGRAPTTTTTTTTTSLLFIVSFLLFSWVDWLIDRLIVVLKRKRERKHGEREKRRSVGCCLFVCLCCARQSRKASPGYAVVRRSCSSTAPSDERRATNYTKCGEEGRGKRVAREFRCNGVQWGVCWCVLPFVLFVQKIVARFNWKMSSQHSWHSEKYICNEIGDKKK